MTSKTCKCGTQYEDMGFKTLCSSCYAKSVNGSKRIDVTQDIHRQVFLKIASEQLRGIQPKELIKYAQELEKEWEQWK
jgi:hypothetical protein